MGQAAARGGTSMQRGVASHGLAHAINSSRCLQLRSCDRESCELCGMKTRDLKLHVELISVTHVCRATRFRHQVVDLRHHDRLPQLLPGFLDQLDHGCMSKTAPVQKQQQPAPRNACEPRGNAKRSGSSVHRQSMNRFSLAWITSHICHALRICHFIMHVNQPCLARSSCEDMVIGTFHLPAVEVNQSLEQLIGRCMIVVVVLIASSLQV